MKAFPLTVMLMLITLANNAQNNSNAGSNKENRIYTNVEQKPYFEGGDKGLAEFLEKNIVYPKAEKDKGIDGKVVISFVVDEKGAVTDAIVLKSISPGLDKEALRVVNLLPKFKPGIMAGKAVKVFYTLPVNFNLGND
jgi:protein TonB